MLEYSPEHPIYVVAFSLKGINFSYGKIQQEIAKSLGAKGDFFVVCNKGGGKALTKKVKNIGRRIIWRDWSYLGLAQE